MFAARTCILVALLLASCSKQSEPVSSGQTVDIKATHGDSDVPLERTQNHPPSTPAEPPTPTPASKSQEGKSRGIQAALHKTFSSYVGIKEEPMGSNNGPMVNKFNASCGLDPSEHAPWCASCTHYGYAQNGLQSPGAYSPSWFVKSRVVSRDRVGPEDVALVYFPSKGRFAHTIACVEKVTWSTGRAVAVTTLEGNTNAQGSREGDQFARRIRPADTLTFVRWWNQ